MAADFITRLLFLNSQWRSLEQLEMLTCVDRIKNPTDGLLQLECDRMLRDIDETRETLEVQFRELHRIAALN